MDLKGLHGHKSTWDWAEIIKSLIDVLSGQAHNRLLNETLGLLIQYQLASDHRPSEELIHGFGEFYRNQFRFYLEVMEPKQENIFTFFEPEDEEEDPRYLAWEDTGKLMNVYFHLSGNDPISSRERAELLDRAIGNLTSVIQSGGIRGPDREKLTRVIEFIKGQAKG